MMNSVNLPRREKFRTARISVIPTCLARPRRKTLGPRAVSISSPALQHVARDRVVFSDQDPHPVTSWQNSASKLLDRKSTRLNSSHRCISYAVFCLKKKKQCTRQNEY